jgi:Uncharacterized protein conserved in bacteria
VSKTIRLRQPVPVLITYSTVIVKNDKVYFFPDLYGQDALLDKALRQRVRTGPLSAHTPQARETRPLESRQLP